MYRLVQTFEAKQDIKNLAAYMKFSLKNQQAANNFLDLYYKQIQTLKTFPYAYRGVNFTYKGYEIRMKAFSSYNIFYVIDTMNHRIIILRVLKSLQNWEFVLNNEDEYSF